MTLQTAHTAFPELQPLSAAIEVKPECFALGSDDIRAAALSATKFLFDLSVLSEKQSTPHIIDLLTSLEPSAAPRTRSQDANGRRKRTPSPPPAKPAFESTPLTSLFIEGMDDEQVWAQLDLRAKNVCETLQRVLEGGPDGDVENEEEDNLEDAFEDERLTKALEAMENGEDVDFDALRDIVDSDEDAFLDEDSEERTNSEEHEDEDEDDGEDDGNDGEDFGEGITHLRDPPSEGENEELPSHGLLRRKPKNTESKGSSELDDGFFDLASFNAETEQAEARSSSRGRLGGDEDPDDDDDDVSIDLFAPVDDEGVEDEGEEPMYRDFFEPPPRPTGKSSKFKTKNHPSKPTGQVRFHEEVRVKKIKPNGKNLPLHSMDADDDDEDGYEEEAALPPARSTKPLIADEEDGAEGSIISGDGIDDGTDEDMGEEESDEDMYDSRGAVERLKDDLFAEEESGPDQDLSTHEKRMAELRDQISELESQNVGPKDWVLMGEAGSRTRPQNSLLEEDLEFERATKAVPVVTEETVQALEERIKARIFEGRFDDVVRIRPIDDKPFLPSRFFELKDTKSSQSLAQIYEDEFVAAQTGGIAGDDRDGKLKKEHTEIEQLWEGICHKLDALCNAHFMPKQPKATISTVANVSTATLESALPTTKSATTMLAPEEVFAPSASELRARSELTPAEKRALRGKERKAKKKSRDALEKDVDKYARARGIGGVKKQKRAALESVIKSGKGVTIVGKTKVSSTKKSRPSRS
ncbi:hypothetical protein DXG03_007052 [Asterophora parasitica]|uniref:U3 small nucleolar ribonucleoprotein protein MPP10 n=1 Tax=Asterophora parasitica TaxID=117018 RepID=A0A9P7GG59_9AGAR|nr:hypothetical protein DXG03_007052 [Asterophora parasitica]